MVAAFEGQVIVCMRSTVLGVFPAVMLAQEMSKGCGRVAPAVFLKMLYQLWQQGEIVFYSLRQQTAEQERK